MVKYMLDPNTIMAMTSVLMIIIVGVQVWISSKQNRILEMQSKISKASTVSAILNLIQESDKMLLDNITVIERYRDEKSMPKELALAMVNEFKKCRDESVKKHKEMLEVLGEK